MTRRQLYNKVTEDVTTSQTGEQLSPEQFVGYARLSTTRQVQNSLESIDMQLSGAQKYAVLHGIEADKIVALWEGEGKRGVSGTLRIDQREKLQEIMTGIEADIIKVVWAYSVSRLFRDKYGVQVGTFVEACAKHHVKVVIETAQTFDFTDQMHVLIFQILANVAAKENEDRSILLHEANRNKARRGEYHGRPLTPGYIIDRDKTSSTYGKYIEYTPHADVARSLYARFRQLNGQFNVLVHEVAAMPYVFPDFEAWVDERDINRFLNNKVPGGYTLTKTSLLHLLTAVEYAGYWKLNGELLLDENGAPKKNHAAIIPLDDWQYAFNALSFVTLQGEENTARPNQRATWKPVKKDRQEPLLVGLLTAPNGTVQYSRGTFRVMEKRPGHLNIQSATLLVNTDMVDTLFMSRLRSRYSEISSHSHYKIMAEIASAKERNAKALVSVDDQIAKYERTIASKQAVLGALGADLDIQTAKKYNAEIKEARAELDDLRNKKNAATAEECSLQELHEKIRQVMLGKLKDREAVRRFIRLATDKIELSECSAHFATLTVTWSAPFNQVDVGYIYLAEGVHGFWNEQDIADLNALYPSADRLTLLQRYPGRSWSGIMSYANDKGLKRYTSKNSSEIPINLSLLDVDIMQRIGIEPGNKASYEHVWVNDVSEVSSVPGCRCSPAHI